MSAKPRPETCTKPIGEACELHPVDCPNCQYGNTCTMRAIMEPYKDTVKRCRFFDPLGEAHEGHR